MKKIERIKDKVIIALVYLITIVLAVLLLMSCYRKNPDGSYDLERSPAFHVIRIDSCEYIQHSYGFAHKGNCRFCLERNKKLIKEQLDSTLIEIFD
jgi:hypothetical protein